jgi:hypothetical protein
MLQNIASQITSSVILSEVRAARTQSKDPLPACTEMDPEGSFYAAAESTGRIP